MVSTLGLDDKKVSIISLNVSLITNQDPESLINQSKLAIRSYKLDR